MSDPVVIAGQAALLTAGLVALGASLHLRDLVRAIAAFAAGSAFVAGAFFLLNAPFAAVLELTVGAGLIAVLFLVAITLTGGSDDAKVTE